MTIWSAERGEQQRRPPEPDLGQAADSPARERHRHERQNDREHQEHALVSTYSGGSCCDISSGEFKEGSRPPETTDQHFTEEGSAMKARYVRIALLVGSLMALAVAIGAPHKVLGARHSLGAAPPRRLRLGTRRRAS